MFKLIVRFWSSFLDFSSRIFRFTSSSAFLCSSSLAFRLESSEVSGSSVASVWESLSVSFMILAVEYFDDFEQFFEVWQKFDDKLTQLISYDQLQLLLHQLDMPLKGKVSSKLVIWVIVYESYESKIKFNFQIDHSLPIMRCKWLPMVRFTV